MLCRLRLMLHVNSQWLQRWICFDVWCKVGLISQWSHVLCGSGSTSFSWAQHKWENFSGINDCFRIWPTKNKLVEPCNIRCISMCCVCIAWAINLGAFSLKCMHRKCAAQSNVIRKLEHAFATGFNRAFESQTRHCVISVLSFCATLRHAFESERTEQAWLSRSVAECTPKWRWPPEFVQQMTSMCADATVYVLMQTKDRALEWWKRGNLHLKIKCKCSLFSHFEYWHWQKAVLPVCLDAQLSLCLMKWIFGKIAIIRYCFEQIL